MYAPADHLIHVLDEPLARDVDAQSLRALLARGVACRPPVSAAVYGVLLNDAGALSALGDAVHAPPYKAPPNAPVLYVKPRNTHVGHRARVMVPEGVPGIQVGGSLGIVIGRTASRVPADAALQFVAGYTIVADLSVPHESLYRPSVRFRARDGFCVIGPAVVASRHVPDPDALGIVIDVEGKPTFEAHTSTSIRGVARLIAEVTEFMTLSCGDVLTLGVPHGAPLAPAGVDVRIAIADWPPLGFSTIAERSAP
ncbi:fumarylacetoacetate hydrolase family protein [Trinickia soli]|uniref:fumarylacetoacetate hydrolase family protein n=1 Tax=Trinickia soli TaxID=380675 RepID=UPI003FA3B5F3